MQYEELQEAVEEAQPAMYNSRLKDLRNADLKEGKVQKRPEACPAFEQRSAQQTHRSGTTKSFNYGKQGHIRRYCRQKNADSRHCGFARSG